MPEAERPKRPRPATPRKRQASRKGAREPAGRGPAPAPPAPPAPDVSVPEVEEGKAPAAPQAPAPKPPPPAPEPPPPAQEPPPPAPEPPPAAPEPPPPAPEAPLVEPAASPPVDLPAVLAPAARTAYDVLWDTGLPNVVTLIRRDLTALFNWPLAYGIAAAVIVPVSILGYLMPVFARDAVTMEGVFSWLAVATAFLTPLVTMRLLAEQRRSGALELLLASPVRFWELVAARWLAGLVFFLATTTFTLLYVGLLAVYQPNLDSGAILTGYLGIAMVGAAWVALGLLASSLTRSRLVAAVAGVAALLVLQYVLGTAAGFLSPPLSDLLDYASAANRARSFERGQVVLRDVVYFVSLTAGALFLTARVLASRRLQGRRFDPPDPPAEKGGSG